MNDPYQILGVSHAADEAAVRARYLELVRQFPPDREPDRFAEIHEAYDRVRDPVVSLEHRLFDVSAPFTFESLIADARPDVRSSRLPTELLLSLARP
ncbi:MAG: J domain-containing protein [Planctomycetota bacterium]|nr:J domain-containing protein [Planctomycetota bacterium]